MAKASGSNSYIADLVHRLAEAEAALSAALVDAEVDAIVDPASATPILLRQAQEALTITEARYSRLITHLAAIIFELKPDGTTVFVNEAITRITGYTDEELQGKNWWTVFFPGERIQEARALQQRLVASDVTQYGVTLTAKDGLQVILEMNSANYYSAEGALQQIVGLGIDVTQRKRVEAELEDYRQHLESLVAQRTAELERVNEALQQEIIERKKMGEEREELLHREQAARAAAEEANAFKLRFLAMISHELRTPLTSIKGFTSTLLTPDVEWNAEQIHEFIQIVDSEANNLVELVENLMDISRMQAAILRITPERVTVKDVLEIARSRIEAVTVHHELQINIPEDLPHIWADTKRIAQVLINLIENAAKYSPPGTKIVLSARRVDDTLQIDISDQGQGIPLDARSSIFEAFSQVDQRTTTQHGAGLGLAICKGLVEAHGGRIWVQERPGPGTTFSFILPVLP
jgi:PAS domain S-box-containing protein